MHSVDRHWMEQAFPGRPDSVAKVRAWARDYWTCHGAAEAAIEDAVLVLSELASNAVEHTRSGGPQGCFKVLLRRGNTRLRMEVTDAGSSTAPMARTVDPLDLGSCGRGLALVNALAEQWRVRGDNRSWTVTAEIAAPARALALQPPFLPALE